MGGHYQVGGGLGLHLPDPRPAQRPVAIGMHDHMREVMGAGLHRLGVIDIVTDPDFPFDQLVIRSPTQPLGGATERSVAAMLIFSLTPPTAPSGRGRQAAPE